MFGLLMKDAKVVIPVEIIDAVKNGRAIPFLGAGASKEATDVSGKRTPDANQLRDILANTFFGKSMPNHDVMAVAEMAISLKGGQGVVFEEVRKILEPFQPGTAHKLLSTFRWRAMATINYDLLVEKAYAGSPDRRQDIVRIVKDDEPIIERLQQTLNSLPYLKLHGCLDSIHDEDIPLILSRAHYERYMANRERLYTRLKDMAHESTFIFIGNRLDDTHIRSLLYRISPDKRPRWFHVNPDLEDTDIEFWNTQNVGVISQRFGDFITALDRSVEPLFRVLSTASSAADLPIRRFYNTHTIESDETRHSLQKDYLFVHTGLASDNVTPLKFYQGYDPNWSGILQRLDVRRTVEDKLLLNAVIANEGATEPKLFILRGAAGSGKTVALKRTAMEASTENLVLWFNSSGAFRTQPIVDIINLSQRTIYLFVDQIGLYAEEVSAFLTELREKSIPVVVIGAEREADWNAYCSKLEADFQPEFLKVGNLALAEVEGLLDLLKFHNCLGMLKEKTRDEQVSAFMDQAAADRQLLVALHELTLGRAFEEIILDEYNRIFPEAAQQVYLDIATMHQFGVPARAGPISRLGNFSLTDFDSRFFGPLENIIQVGIDNYSGDAAYRSRHQRVASIVFKQVCNSDELKIQQFERIISQLDIGYSSDSKIISGITRGHALANNVTDVVQGRKVYAAAHELLPNTAFVFQQQALFELRHSSGSITIAEEAITKARELDPYNRTILHSEGEIARRKATVVESALHKESLRRKAREIFSKMPNGNRFAMCSLCKVLIDEIRDLQNELPSEPRPYELQRLQDKYVSTEKQISRTMQLFPSDPDVMQIEAQFRTEIEQEEKALRAYERAWNSGARGSGTAIRLSRLYEARGREADGLTILSEALERSPDDKSAHHMLAKLIFKEDRANLASIEHHLKKSFDVGDSNFDARFDLAQFYFVTGQTKEAVSQFAAINNTAPDIFRKMATTKPTVFSKGATPSRGSIVSQRGGSVFLKSPIYPKDLIAFRSQSDADEFDELSPGDEVNFIVGFNRQGPVALDVKRI